MSNNNRRSEWTVLVGLGLVALGIWLFLNTFFGWLVAPLAAIISVASRVIWPLILIGLGVLLVLRARGGGWAPSGRSLYRSRDERMVAGVLGGVAKWLGVNPTPLRLVYVLLTVFTAFWPGVLAYVLAAVLLPEEPWGVSEDYVPPAAPPVPPAVVTPTPPAPPAAPASAPVEPPAPAVTPPPSVSAEPPVVPAPASAFEPPAPPAMPASEPEPPAPAAPPAPPVPPAS